MIFGDILPILLGFSLLLNFAILIAIVIFVKKPELISSYIDQNHKKRVEELKDWYHKEEQRLTNQLASRTAEVAQEVSKLRNELEKEIAAEVAKSRSKRIDELDKELAYRISAMKEREAMMESKLISDFEIFRLDVEFQQEEIQKRLDVLKSYEAAAIEARIREYEEKNKEKFYTIDLSEDDILEIEELNSIIPKLRNPRPLKQAIFSIYYKGPMKDMINRVVGQEKRVSGIYKITLLSTGECYVGQSVDLKSRWMQHARRGFGLDEWTQNKLYPAMQKYGLYNFKFEVVEVCEEEFLTEKEKYWTEYFGAQVFGYTMKA